MKKILISFAMTLWLNYCNGQSDEISDVIDQIETALSQANKEIGDQTALPKVKSAEITLETTVSKKIGGKFKIIVISFGSTVSKERSQKITVSLVPKIGKTPVSGGGFIEELKSLIVETSNGLQNAANGSYPMSVKEATVELRFVLKRDKEGGGTFKIIPVSAELTGDLTKEIIHGVKLVF